MANGLAACSFVCRLPTTTTQATSTVNPRSFCSLVVRARAFCPSGFGESPRTTALARTIRLIASATSRNDHDSNTASFSQSRSQSQSQPPSSSSPSQSQSPPSPSSPSQSQSPPSPSPSQPTPLPPLRYELSLHVGTHVIPHPNKVERGGEDAFFVSSCVGGVIGIADGVSGWAEQNVDPALFSQEIMSHASSFVDNEEVSNDPRALLRKAHDATVSVGSATVIIAMLERNGILRIATVGDCGLRVIRKGQVIFATSPQEHYFDCPYQLSSQAVGQTYLDAVVTSIELIEGDLIVMGSDGLFDNVFDQEIISTVAEHTDVAKTAKELASLSKDHSTDSNFDSPYSLEARARGFDVPAWRKILGGKLTGGKLDDITVIVARVVSS